MSGIDFLRGFLQALVDQGKGEMTVREVFDEAQELWPASPQDRALQTAANISIEEEPK